MAIFFTSTSFIQVDSFQKTPRLSPRHRPRCAFGFLSRVRKTNCYSLNYFFIPSNMDDCSICYESVNKTTGHCTLACEHTFHISCLTKWTEKTPTCPLCRHSMTEKETPAKSDELGTIPSIFDLAAAASGLQFNNSRRPPQLREEDITIVMHQTDVSHARAEELLLLNDGDIVNSILQVINETPVQPRDPLTTPTHEQTMAWMIHRVAHPNESRYKWGSYSDMILRTRRGIHYQHQQWYHREFSEIKTQRGYDSS